MARRKDVDWHIPSGKVGDIPTPEQACIAVLMDIRDELKKLNIIVGCSNAIDIPNILRRIDENTKKAKRKTRR